MTFSFRSKKTLDKEEIIDLCSFDVVIMRAMLNLSKEIETEKRNKYGDVTEYDVPEEN